MVRFEYLEPASLKEALSLLNKYGDEARALAGGTDLLTRLKHRLLNIKYLVNIKKLPGLDGIEYNAKDGLKIGALTTIRSLEKSDAIKDSFKPLWEAACVLGSVQVRNLATLGGNLCHAAPSAETAPPLLALDAGVVIAGARGERNLPLRDFFKGPGKTALKSGEILTAITIPPHQPETGGSYYKLGSRQAMDIAIVGVASVVSIQDGVCSTCRIGLGSVAPTPIRAVQAEKWIEGKKLEPETLGKAGILAMNEASPISDHRGSAEYRREMIKALTIKTLREASKRASPTLL